MTKLHIDIETYCELDIKEVGAYKYAAHESFEIILIAYAVDDRIIITDEPKNNKISPFIIAMFNDENVIIHAHNAAFERIAFAAIGYDIPVNRWRCSMIQAAYCGLPLQLEKVSEVLRLAEKGKLSTGKALIRYFCKPCRPTAVNGRRTRNTEEHDTEKWQMFIDYCVNDVEAERAIFDKLEKYTLPEAVQKEYEIDQIINDTGILVDTKLAQNCIEIDTENTNEIKEKIIKVSGIQNPNSAVQLKKWLSAKLKFTVTGLTKEDVPTLLELAEKQGLKEVAEVLDGRKRLAKTSVKKYTAMINCAGADKRARGLFQFYGANRTGRWSGRLVQLQNLPRNYIEHINEVREEFKNHSFNVLSIIYADISKTLSQLTRTAFVAPEGKTLAVADFSAIEARVLAWVAGEKWRLDVFNTTGKIYEASAAVMFNVDIKEVTKGSDLRQRGKIAELALGYGGSVGAMQQMGAEKMGLTTDEMRNVVNIWRRKNPKITQLWRDVEAAAIYAVKTKKGMRVNGLEFRCDSFALRIKLPSGRELFYNKPQLTNNRWGKQAIKYQGVDQTTKQWTWVETYGGKLVENIIQAIARDLLANAIDNAHTYGFKIVMHVHDEIVAEVHENYAKQELVALCRMMEKKPAWAVGLPLAAEGYTSKFYKKD